MSRCSWLEALAQAEPDRGTIPRMPCDPLRDLRAWQERLERLAHPQPEPWTPPIDVYETTSGYVITVEVPGVTRDQIELVVEDTRLTIRGRRLDMHDHLAKGGARSRAAHRSALKLQNRRAPWSAS